MKKFLAAVGVLLIGGLFWYLFLKSYDYKVTFMVNTNIGKVNRTIKTWNINLEDSKIEVTSWDKVTDSLEYNFCYPIIASDNLPAHPLLRGKEVPARRTLKAVYNGNYINSDRAWYALLDYAQKTEEDVTSLPIEFFHNNPNMGGDELLRKAEVYMPLKEDADE